jgi:hypothetical protein
MNLSHASAAICLLALLTESCADEGPAFTIDPALTKSQREAVVQAAAKWNTVVIHPVTVSGGDWRIFIGRAPPGYKGWTDGHNRTVTIDPTTREEDFYPLVLHELGHAVGLVHHAAPGVMNPTSGATEFTAADLAGCSDRGRC